MKDFESELKKILPTACASTPDSESGPDYCGHKGDPDQLDAYLFSVVDDLDGEEDFPDNILECHYCLDRLLIIQESVLAAEEKPIKPLRDALLQLKKTGLAQKLRIQIHVLKESFKLLACPGFSQPSLAPAMVRGSADDPTQLFLNREFNNFHLNILLFLEEDQTVTMALKLTETHKAGKLPNRFRLLKEKRLIESLKLIEPEVSLDHLSQGSYIFEFLSGEENLGSFSLDLR